MRLFFLFIIVATIGASCSRPPVDLTDVRSEIDSILLIQDNAYQENSEPARQRMAATCVDSLLFVGGDDGGMVMSAQFYAHDLADGFIERPHDRTYQLYDNTVITTAVFKSYKLFNRDTIYFHNRSTKVFIKDHGKWKMASIAIVPIATHYERRISLDPKALEPLAGIYEGPFGATDTVSIVDGKLVLSPASVLVPLNDSTFISEDYPGRTVFHRDKQGRVGYNYYEFVDGQRVRFKKLK